MKACNYPVCMSGGGGSCEPKCEAIDKEIAQLRKEVDVEECTSWRNKLNKAILFFTTSLEPVSLCTSCMRENEANIANVLKAARSLVTLVVNKVEDL